MFRIQFTVKGSGEFPYDMLRYDACFPQTSTDINIMMDRAVGQREVRMVTCRAHKTDTLTPARWESFGWTVDARTIAVEKVK